MKSETQRQIAERIVNEHLYFLGGREQVADAIEAAIKDRDERAAKMLEDLLLKQSFVAAIWAGTEQTKRQLHDVVAKIRGVNSNAE